VGIASSVRDARARRTALSGIASSARGAAWMRGADRGTSARVSISIAVFSIASYAQPFEQRLLRAQHALGEPQNEVA
jgi:hypothetical protein